MIGWLFIVLGVACMAVVGIDAFLTMVGLHRGGPVTNRWTRSLWLALRWAHGRRPMHGVLALAGPAMMVLAVAFWYFGIVLGWFLVFVGGQYLEGGAAVINNTTGERADGLDTLYFVGSGTSTAGFGDFVGGTFPWTFLGTVAAFTGTFLVTLSLSYIMPVVQAALHKPIIASRVFLMGSDAKQIVSNAWMNGDQSYQTSYRAGVFGTLSEHAHQHRVYPMLRYFHAGKQRHSSSRAVLELADMVHLLRLIDDEFVPPPCFLMLAANAIEEYAALAGTSGEGADGPRPPEVADVRALGLRPVNDSEQTQAWLEYEPTRRRLVALCHEDGWC